MMLGCLVLASGSFASADEDLVPPINPDAHGQALVSTDVSALNNKVSELERKVNDIEREQRFNQERLRQLDRDVSELRRKF